jgi:hypothetical protein
MNQKLMLLLLFIMLFFIELGFAQTYGTLTFTSDISGPGAYGSPKEISSGVNFYIDITANYNKLQGNSNRMTWSSPFIFYGYNIANVTWGDTSTFATTTFKYYFDFFKTTYVESWNDGLPDKYNFTGVGNDNGLPGGGTLAFHIPCKVTLKQGYTSGWICVDSADMDNNAYDWIFDDPFPNFSATYWTVRARTINLSGQIKIKNYTTGIDEPFPYFKFDVVTPSDTANPVASGITDATGNYSIFNMPAFNDNIWLKLTSFQSPELFAIYKYGTMNSVNGYYRTTNLGTGNQIVSLTMSLITLSDPEGNFFFKTARMIKDIHTTDTIMSKYGINIDSLDIRTGDYHSTGSCWYLWNGKPYIRLDSAQWSCQAASHEIGHQILYQIQNYTDDPCTTTYISADPFAVTDTLYAFKEGFPDFIRAISSDPTVLKDAFYHESYDSNYWWMGPFRFYPAWNWIGEIVPGSVTSMLLDLYDDNNNPKIQSDDDNVGQTSFMMPKLMHCIQDYVPANRTWSFPTFTWRLLRDSTRSWYGDSTFKIIRPAICEILTTHHHTPADDKSYCKPTHGLENETTPAIPMQFTVSQNYPNPFNGGTRIEFSISEPGDCIIEIYNILGQRVWNKTLPEMTAGRHFVSLDNKDIENLASSVYYYKITNNNNSIVKRMLILK